MFRTFRFLGSIVLTSLFLLFYVTREFYRFLSPLQTDATLLANNSQHCWMSHVPFVCTPCGMLLRVIGSCCAKFETSQTLSYMQTDAIRPNNVGRTVTLTALVAAFYYCIASWRTVENIASVGWALKAIHSQICSYVSH